MSFLNSFKDKMAKLNEASIALGNRLTLEPEVPSEEELAKNREEFNKLLETESVCPRCGQTGNHFQTMNDIDQLADFPHFDKFRRYTCSKCQFSWDSKKERIPLDPEKRRKYYKRVYGIDGQ